MAAKKATIVGDVTGLQQRHHPYDIPHLVKKIKDFPLKAKSFQNTATYQLLRGGVPSTPLPCTAVAGGMNLHIRPRVKKTTYVIIILRYKSMRWDVASLHQSISHPRVKISNQLKSVLLDLSVLMIRELSKAYFSSLLMMMILHITYIVTDFEINICSVRLLYLYLPWASHERKTQSFC